MKRIRFFFVLLLSGTALRAQQTLPDTTGWNTPRSYAPMVSYGQLLGAIAPLRDLPPQLPPEVDTRPGKLWHKHNYFKDNDLNNPMPLPQGGDPLANAAAERSDAYAGPQLDPLLSFAGLSANITPPDPNGDVGKNHFMQMTNAPGGAQFRIWNKQGAPVYGPAATSTIWSQVNSGSYNDPVIQYDPGAERWLMLELQGGLGSNELLIAVSDDSDPTGSWKAYRFQTLGFPDYPKLDVWPDAYFVTVNEVIGSNECSGYALEKAALLAGAEEFKIYRFEMPNYLGVGFQPATAVDWEAGPPPPAGSPGYVFRVYDDAWNGGADQLQRWDVHVDWLDESQSHIDGPHVLYPAPFELKVCYNFNDCLEQPNANAPRLAALENIIMYRAVYRNFGDHESIVFNHVVDVSGQTGAGGDAQVRWYEIRKTGGGPWQIYQEGTYAPDLPTNRFMGAISMDAEGNIALGYSVCSDHTFPGLRLTGRRAGDPPGLMPIEEYTLKAGGGSYNQSNRWGDYSSMSVDPEDGRTFWFTGEYQPGSGSWGTWIGSFRIERDTFDVTPETLSAPQASALLGAAEPVTVEVLNGGLEPASGIAVTLRFEGATVVTDLITETINPGQKLAHTFSQTVAMTEVGKFYDFEIITAWPADNFAGNDTLRVRVQRLTEHDAAIPGKVNLPGLVCGAEQTAGIILRNVSGLPLQSAELHWRLNNTPYVVVPWTGNLAPGERDTIFVTLSGIGNGLNGLRAFCTLPNGQDDQNKLNDTLIVKFIGNLDGTYLTLKSETDFGLLRWELRTPTYQLLLADDLPGGSSIQQICADDATCYRFIVRSTTEAWQGKVELLDIYDNPLLAFDHASQAPDTFSFCTPLRQSVDVGALHLLAPLSAPDLSNAEPVAISVRNFGLTPLNDVEVAYRRAGGPWHTETITGPLAAGTTVTHTFSTTEDLSVFGQDYPFEFFATVSGDQALSNDTAQATVRHRPALELALQDLQLNLGCNSLTDVYAVATLYNDGLAGIERFRWTYSVNGEVQPAEIVALDIPPGESRPYYFAVSGAVFGQNELIAALSEVNDSGDDFDLQNNTDTLVFPLTASGQVYDLSLFTDSKPEETRWELLDAAGNVLRSGGPYPTPNKQESDYWCLLPDSCYTFRLYDAGGDGMAGPIFITDPDGNPVWTLDNPNFGSELSVPLCTGASGVGEPAGGRPLHVWPNPTTALVELSLPARGAERTAICEVFNAQGRIMQVARLARWDDRLHGVVSLETYPPGIYWVKIKGLEAGLGARVVKMKR